jgi:Skp family chaperone for outer membrane proteins
MELVTLALIITSTAFLTLGSVAFKQQQATLNLTKQVQAELKAALESLQKLNHDIAAEHAQLKKDVSDLQILNGMKAKK